MKRAWPFILLLLLIGGYFAYSRYLSGLLPASPLVLNPSPDQATPTPNPGTENTTGLPLSLPPGFKLDIFAKNLSDARDLAWDPQGRLVVSIPSRGQIIAFTSTGEPHILASGLNRPHGLAFLGSRLFVGETNQVSVFDYDPAAFTTSNKHKLFDLPAGAGHWTRSLLITNNRLYTSVGSSCNVCTESDSRRAKVFVSDLDGKSLTVFSSGLRNSVFMTLHPDTGKIWATDMGRDWLGNDLPPDEINILESGKDYGWPICYGKNVADTDFGKTPTLIESPVNYCLSKGKTPSHIDLPAHSAPLGLAFIPDTWPAPYRGQLLVAFHGSWNRNPPDGYKIVFIKLDSASQFSHMEDFISGWLTQNTSSGRPVDLLFDPAGNLFISDDKAGLIYRLSPLP